MKRIVVCSLVLFFVALICATGSLAQPLELKAVSFLPKDHRLCAMIPVWIEKVNTEL